MGRKRNILNEYTKMKTKLILIAFAIVILSSCDNGTEYANKHKADYYWNEDFTLVDRKENATVYDNSPAVVRTWVIQRNVVTNDSIELTEINTIFKNGEDCGCATSKFQLTTELWYGKKVGERLHFDYIRKNRFFKKQKDEGVQFNEQPNETQSGVTTKTITNGAVTTTTTTVLPNDMETQNRILELERQKISIESELDRLKIK
jgi:hypothetical protein